MRDITIPYIYSPDGACYGTANNKEILNETPKIQILEHYCSKFYGERLEENHQTPDRIPEGIKLSNSLIYITSTPNG